MSTFNLQGVLAGGRMIFAKLIFLNFSLTLLQLSQSIGFEYSYFFFDHFDFLKLRFGLLLTFCDLFYTDTDLAHLISFQNSTKGSFVNFQIHYFHSGIGGLGTWYL